MSLKKTVRKSLRARGLDLVSYSPSYHPLARRKKFFEVFGVDTVLDIGANSGQYGLELREIGFSGRIVSFEPLDEAFAALKTNAAQDEAWDIYHCALGDSDGRGEINISENLVSSSIMEMLPAHEEAAQASSYVGQQSIDIQKLDSIRAKVCKDSKNIYAKIDVQGFEMQVLAGAQDCLDLIDTIQLEISLTPLYEGAPDFMTLDAALQDKGYELIAVEPAYSDPETARMLQIDGTYHRY